MGVPANFIPDELHIGMEHKHAAGTCHWEFYEKDSADASLNFVCPCGCGEVDFITVKRPIGNPNVYQREWKWDGNRETPTITPSILRRGSKCQWHGYLTNGEFVNC